MKKFAIVLFMALLASNAFAGTYSGGTGTSVDPYQIATTADLIELSNTSGDWGAYFKQTADIAFNADSTQVDWDGDGTASWDTEDQSGFSPIGNNTTKFTGTYDGDGKTISHLYIHRAESTGSYQGLFGLVDGASLNGIGLKSIHITGNDYTGGLTGEAINACSINYCYTQGVVTGYDKSGGLIGSIQSHGNTLTISVCYSTCEVNAYSNSGGLVGAIWGGTVSDCYATGSVTSDSWLAGGFAGELYSNGGINPVNISQCYSSGAVSAPSYAQGFSHKYDPDEVAITVTNCFWDKEASVSVSDVGTGKTTGQMKTESTFTDAGWDFTTPVWAIEDPGTTGYHSYPYLSSIEQVPPPGLVPVSTYSGGDGSESDPWQIATTGDLIFLSLHSYDWDKHFIQTADIDFGEDESAVDWDGNGEPDGSGTNGFSPIGGASETTISFSGIYNGNGHIINHLYINQPDDINGFGIGLLGMIDASEVKNVRLTNANITGFMFVGGLIGASVNSSVTNNYCSGDIAGQGLAGGLIGFTAESNETNNCYSNCSVSGMGWVGGLIGVNSELSTVTNCYSSGDVARISGYTETTFGSLIGSNGHNLFRSGVDGGDISYCYATGNVFYEDAVDPTDKGFVGASVVDVYTPVYTANFFDMEAYNQTTATGAAGKSTAEMKTLSTFTDAGWDFVVETTNGSNDYWNMNASHNSGYPFLVWQYATITWDGSESSAWNTAGNWDLNAVPTASDDVMIANAGTPVIASGVGASCNDLAVNSGAVLTVNPGGSLITNGSITNNGSIQIKQALADDGEWHLVSAPNSNTTANTFYGMFLQQWNEPAASWSDITDPAAVLAPVKGFSLWSPSTKGSFTYTGTPNTGNQSISVTAGGTGENYTGANLLGNPYPSYLDWDQVTGYGAKYTWNGTAYDAYTQTGGYGTGSRYAAPMEGFFVVMESAGTFSLTNAMRTHQPPVKNDGEKHLQKGLILAATNGSYNDDLWLVFDVQASENFELQRDAWKLLSSTGGLSQLWSVSTDGNLAVDVRPEQEIYQLGFANDLPGVYTIGIKEIADITSAMLEDTKTGKFHNLQNGAYEFAWNPELDDETRFKLHLNTVGIEETPISESDILIYAANNQIFIKNVTGVETHGRPSILSVSDMMGRIVLRQEIRGDETISIPVNLQTGVYLVTVQNGNEIETEKVFIK